MEPVTRQQLSRAFLAMSHAFASASPVTAALCAGLGRGPTPACEALFDQYFRIISAAHFNLPTFLAALHHMALSGEAPSLAHFFPSCGGGFIPEEGAALIAAAERCLEERREEVLDFLLTYEPRNHEVRRAAAVLLGALATVERLGGGLSLVQMGAQNGLLLQFDRYAYRLGAHQLGDSPLLLETAVNGNTAAVDRLLGLGMVSVVGRLGIDQDPADLRDPEQRRIAEAFIPPDQADRLARLRGACGLLDTAGEAPHLRRGLPELDLGRLLVEAYNEMAPGNTLLLFSLMSWTALDDEAQKRIALGVQSLAAQVRPHKPIAWLQAEEFTPGRGVLELRLHTFGWADLEDRSVVKLAEADPDLAWIRWLE
ncbi:MAG: DUF2332 family protein [Bacillota bacterium]